MKPGRGRPMLPAKRDAIARGERYYRGSPCQRGHMGERYVSTGACVDCVRES